jgi:hypothetical protein
MSPPKAFALCPRCGERHAPTDSHRPNRLLDVSVEGFIRRCPYCYFDWIEWLDFGQKAS